jgi:hypothetical protein
MVTGESQVQLFVTSALLAGNDVFYVVCERKAPRLAEGDNIRNGDLRVPEQTHAEPDPSGSSACGQKPTRFGLENGDKVTDVD